MTEMEKHRILHALDELSDIEALMLAVWNKELDLLEPQPVAEPATPVEVIDA